jgi:hypothetical protein
MAGGFRLDYVAKNCSQSLACQGVVRNQKIGSDLSELLPKSNSNHTPSLLSGPLYEKRYTPINLRLSLPVRLSGNLRKTSGIFWPSFLFLISKKMPKNLLTAKDIPIKLNKKLVQLRFVSSRVPIKLQINMKLSS